MPNVHSSTVFGKNDEVDIERTKVRMVGSEGGIVLEFERMKRFDGRF
jgi:hypothetical protein